MNLVIHNATARQLDDNAANPYHALLLVGPDGIGKTSLARQLASRLLTVAPLERHPYYLFLTPADNGTVSIEAVREMQKFLQLKTTGKGLIRRIVCLEHADGLTQEAQNALLKLLEEPPIDTVIILTVHNKRALLPTILSRVHTLQVHLPPRQELEAFFAKKSSGEDIRKAFFLSGGLPGLMSGLLEDAQNHPLLAQVTIAKELLQKPVFERLGMIDLVLKQKNTLPQLLEALARIAASGLMQASATPDIKSIKRWHNIQKEIFQAQEALAHSANSKLVLTKMLLYM